MSFGRALRRQAARFSGIAQTPKQLGANITRDFMEGRITQGEAREKLLQAGGGNLVPMGPLRSRLERSVDERMERLRKLKVLYDRANEMKRTGEDKTNPQEYQELLTKAEKLA